MVKKERNYNRRYPYEYNIFRTMFYYGFLYTVVVPFMKIFYNYEITGRENLPTKAKSGKFLLIFTVANIVMLALMIGLSFII